MSEIFSRELGLIGQQGLDALWGSKVAIFGLGGVGGTCFQALVRSGVGNFLLVDGDVVEESNLNRQILFASSDLGKPKVEVAERFAASISSPNIKAENKFLTPGNISDFGLGGYDLIIDCIDDLKAKVARSEFGLANGKKLLLSLGVGNRLDPSKVTYAKLSKTYNCPLGKRLREELRKRRLNLDKLTAVFSTEPSLLKSKTPSSSMMVPSSAGLLLSYLAVSYLLKKPAKV